MVSPPNVLADIALHRNGRIVTGTTDIDLPVQFPRNILHRKIGDFNQPAMSPLTTVALPPDKGGFVM